MKEERETRESFENFENCNPKQTQALKFFLFPLLSQIFDSFQRIKIRDIHLLRVVEERESKKRDDGG